MGEFHYSIDTSEHSTDKDEDHRERSRGQASKEFIPIVFS
jgi:hypothetical protein